MVLSQARTGRGARNSAGASVWAESRETLSRRPALPGSASADVAIIGAGFTGLWAAYYLLKDDPSLRVVLLERECAGFGASGRNGGWCSAIFPVSLDRVRKLYSHQAALDLQRAMNETVAEVGRVAQDEGVDCDFAAEGFVSLARTPAQLARAKATVSATEAFGVHGQWQLLSGEQARAKINAEGTLGGVHTPHCALLHPGQTRPRPRHRRGEPGRHHLRGHRGHRHRQGPCAHRPELFPTELRASGVGVAVAASRLGSAASTFLLPIVVDAYGVDIALTGCVVVLVIGGLICWAWAPETGKESLTGVDEAPAKNAAHPPVHWRPQRPVNRQPWQRP
ncbi:FAD-dependent oxidoreductase [Streptomyces sp. NPDC005962]|uniref:NAD(P)/FAD-dependent oxidoreductase n=1 Tax=Streptomyces sp. NPDC005962 TaxID=3154466 RepID=UPI0033D50402